MWGGAALFCPKCTFANPASAAFCSQCGSPLAATHPGSEPRSSSPAERRQLTVMFCDLVGSTALSSQLDPEELHELTREYQTVCAEVISRYAGYVAQYLGDGLLVYFGYPTAQEDDAQRAVSAGLEIISAVAGLRKPLQVRVAIHTGLAVVGPLGDGTDPEAIAIAGETPNVAARIQSIADPGTVVISAATYRLIEGFFVCRSLGTTTLKGIPAPIELYSALKASGIQSRFERAVAAGLTPFVSREAEIATLQHRWDQSREGAGQVVLVSGEGGVGKSRLVRVLRERTTGDVAEFALRCSSYYQNSTLYPLINLLQRAFRFRPEDDPTAKLEKLEGALKQFGFSLPEFVPLFAALLSLPPGDLYPPAVMTPQRLKQKTLEAAVTWFTKIADQRPTRIFVEDVHWADPSTLELLGLLVEQVPRTRLLLVLVFRSDFSPPWRSQPHVSSISLRRLSTAATESMIESIAGKRFPRDLTGEIVAKTDGVPLFVEELTRMVLESGMLREREDHYELTGSLPSLAIPSTLYDSLMARLDRLGSAKEVAQLAATLGKEFSYELLRAISPLDETRLTGALNRLVDAELFAQHSAPPHTYYSFRHALIRDAAYESLLRSKRRQYHRKVAEVLLEDFPDTVEAQPEVLATHYTEAGLIDQALPFWQRAGQRALERSANQEAIRHLNRGLELLGVLPETPQHAEQEVLLRVNPGSGRDGHQRIRLSGSAKRLCPGPQALSADGRESLDLPGFLGALGISLRTRRTQQCA